MADGRTESRSKSHFAKLFLGFRIAIDPRKLLLAGLGICLTALGWWAVSALFYTRSAPQWNEYENQGDSADAAWKRFRRDRDRWNLLHRLAAPPTARVLVDAGDVAASHKDHDALKAVGDGMQLVAVVDGQLTIPSAKPFPVKLIDEADASKLHAARFADLVIVDEMAQIVRLGDVKLKVESAFNDLKELRALVKPESSLTPAQAKTFRDHLAQPRVKPAGAFRVCPWNEDRGENPYLLAHQLATGDRAPFARGGVGEWLIHEQAPVLLEPLRKFLAPIWHLFSSEGSGWRNRIYLLLVLAWNVAVWGLFGGAITRIAAVQIARNESPSMGEAIAFARERWRSYVAAPAGALAVALLFGLLLMAIGAFVGWTFWAGDLLSAILLPIAILFGLLFAVVFVGFLCWPLMFPTISAEGSDAFDALSRPYSYLYQSPWKFLGYSASALLYGAALTFIVGFLGSLTIYAAKWGLSHDTGLAHVEAAKDRTPIYLFASAPKSFGWRDLLLKDSDWATKTPEGYVLREEYRNEISWANRFAGWVAAGWIGFFFLLVVGFSYSYFWTASTLLYFLLRHAVDDTDLDEVYLEDEEMPLPSVRQAPPAPAQKPGTISLNLIEAPPPPQPPTS